MCTIPLIIVAFATISNAQRPFYAGTRGTAYNNGLVIPPQQAPLDSRFGEENDQIPTNQQGVSTQRIPVEANGDKTLVDILKRRPIDQQPFWLINWMAIEAQKNNGRPLQNPSDNNELNSRFGEENENDRISFIPIVYPLEWQNPPSAA